jgi:hypothetical protein
MGVPMTEERYIWICRWEEFQHYKPERDRGPAWIKDYTKQMLDDRYLALTDRQRALLRDLRDVFAMTGGRLLDDAPTIARYRHRHTRDDDLRALNHAGLTLSLSREDLERSLESLYSSPRARVEGEEDKEPPTPADAGDQTQASGRKSKTRRAKTTIVTCPHCRLAFKAQPLLDEHLYHSHNEPPHWADTAQEPEPLPQTSTEDVELPEVEERHRIAATLRAELLGASANGAGEDELPWEGEEPPVVA